MYRVGQVVVFVYLGWVDLDLGSSLGWWAANVATYCPCKIAENCKSKSTKGFYRGDVSPCTLTHSSSPVVFFSRRHIKEEFEEIFSEDDLKSMNHDELAFAWFS